VRILKRAWALLSLEDSADKGYYFSDLHATVGCHPTSTAEIDSHNTGVDGYKRDLEALIDSEVAKGTESRLVAIGEIGLGEHEHILLRFRHVMLLS
jgi:Tat protein secretion system quality control protein TatD with DNase activity